MSIHKLTAGSGYDYLTRQVAALDATEKGHVPLASYYTERGETPGVWIGSGLAGIDGLKAGDPVTAEQMQALFGVGLHPAGRAAAAAAARPGPDRPGLSGGVAGWARRSRSTPTTSPPFRVEVAKRIAELNAAAGLPSDWPVPRGRTGAGAHRGGDASSSPPSTAGHRRMRGNWPPRSPNTPGRRQPRSPAMT